MWDLYDENYNTMMKEIKESNKQRSICVHGLQDSNSIDVNSPLNLYTGLMQFASKSLQDFVNIDKISLNVMQKGDRTRMAKTVLKRNKVIGVCLSDFKTYYIAVGTKVMWH